MACAMTVTYGRKHDYSMWMEQRSDIFVEDVTRTVVIEPWSEPEERIHVVQNIVADIPSPSLVVASATTTVVKNPSPSIWEKIQTLTNLGELVVNIMQMFS